MERSEIVRMTRQRCQAPGTSGREDGAAEAAEALLSPLGRVERTPLGSVLCHVCKGEPGAPHLMLEAHLDQIGMVVTGITEEGFLHLAPCGGVDRRVLPIQNHVFTAPKKNGPLKMKIPLLCMSISVL